MKPLLLTLQAFGPFAGTQTLDFGQLDGRGFFLIHGPTGAGKTSILDGLCFALFGESSGGERRANELRSHHAATAVLTQVSLEFALGTARYRVLRVPEQTRKAKRGDGLVKQPAEAELHRLDGPEGSTLIAAGASPVTAHVCTLLGYRSDQFRQVIVLAQGRFAEFLKSSSRDREQILQVLFGTTLYKQLEDALKRAADASAQAARDAGIQRQTLLQQAEAAHEDALRQRLVELQADALTKQHAQAAARQQGEATQLAWQQGNHAHQAWTEHDEAIRQRHALDADVPLRRDQRARLEAARRAATVLPQAQARDRAVQVLQSAQDALQSWRTQLAEAQVAHAQAMQAQQQAQSQMPALEATQARLRELVQLAERVQSHAHAESALAAIEAQERQALSALGAAEVTVSDITAKLQSCESSCEAQRLVASRLEAEQLRLDALVRRERDAAALAAARLHATACEARLQTATERLHAALHVRERAVAARSASLVAWMTDQAARLAAGLHDGQACPVCGSVEHPAPAHTQGDLFHGVDLDAADAALAAAERVCEQERRVHAQVAQEAAQAAATVQAAEQAVGDGPSGPVLTEAIADARQATRQAQMAALALDEAQTVLASLRSAQQSAGVRLQQMQHELHGIQARRAAARALLDERAAGLPPGFDAPALTRERDECQARVDAWLQQRQAVDQSLQQTQEALARAQGRHDVAQEHLVRARAEAEDHAQRFAAALTTSGFADVQAYTDALMEPSAQEAITRVLAQHERELAAAADRSARALAAVRDLPRPDLQALQVAAQTAADRLDQATRAAAQAQSALQMAHDLTARITAIAAHYAALEQEHSLLRGLADTAGGQNAARMSFQRYVLATLLEEVLAAASLRLRAMSRGRYALRRVQDVTTGRGAGGLDLEVSDDYTGSTRPVQSLSGGESFLASLALALGLADVVQARSGGVRLDALFVDEGFGTLDPEALDIAIRTLRDLQGAGRLVGIISHVAELREWIPTRLELQASPTGSTATFQF